MIELPGRREGDTLYARAASIAPCIKGLFPFDVDCDLECVPVGDEWLAYSQVQPHPAWRMTERGYMLPITDHPVLHTAAMVHGGVPTKRGYEFRAWAGVAATLAEFGHHNQVAPFDDCRTYIIYEGDNTLVVRTSHEDKDTRPPGWENSLKSYWQRHYENPYKPAISHYAEIIRVVDHQPSDSGISEIYGYYLRKDDGSWVKRCKESLRYALMSRGLSPSGAVTQIGHALVSPFHRICVPFQPEYPEPRVWNMDAPQYTYQPVVGQHSHWDMMFRHVGRDLGEDGPLYLMQWYASILRHPEDRLPYLFLFGPENSGKSIFWEAFSLLVTKGVTKADRALTGEFNAEIEGAVLCAVEERNIAKDGVHERIKDCVTGLKLAIRKMHHNQYEAPNYTHFVQCSNDRAACPIFHGDTRITVIQVDPPEADIPKPLFMERLKEEGPAIMYTLLHLDLPEPTGRLRLPVIESASKQRLQDENASELAQAVVALGNWKGTASQLAAATRVECGTARRVRSTLDRDAAFLKRHGVEIRFPPLDRTKTALIEITRR